MTVIKKCKSLETGTNLTLLRLLYLYEFETRCHLNEWEDEYVKEILHLPFMDIKTLEHVAAIVNVSKLLYFSPPLRPFYEEPP